MCEAPVQCLVCRHRALRLRPPPRSAFQAKSALSARGRERAAALRRCFSPSGSCSTAGSRKTWQGTAFGFARGRRPIRAGGPGSPRGKPGLTRRSSPPPQGGVSRVSRLPVPGATIGAPPGILAAASPVPALGRVRAQALKGSDRQRSRLEARGQEPKAPRRGAVPDPPIRVRALPSDTVRANHPGRADTDTRPALPSGGHEEAAL